MITAHGTRPRLESAFFLFDPAGLNFAIYCYEKCQEVTLDLSARLPREDPSCNAAAPRPIRQRTRPKAASARVRASYRGSPSDDTGTNVQACAAPRTPASPGGRAAS